jgi:glycogen phosphorylase
MAWLAVRGCSWVNGVSALHGVVSRRLFEPIFPRWPEVEVPVHHITNGVHVPSWDSPWTDALWTRAAGKTRWRGDVGALTGPMAEMSDRDLWSVRSEERHDLIRYVRDRLPSQVARQGQPAVAGLVAQDVLQPDVLTLGLARRFTAYKRPNLLLADPDRLVRLLTRPGHPVQLILAGKAHPHDREGKDLVQQWVRFASRPDVRRHVVFLADYDMRMAAELVQGVDLWINTPRRPWEASGTSGMKVLVNGGLNLSVLDGWWAEAYDPAAGWALGDAGDAGDADSLYTLLESTIVPEFYARGRDGLPTAWIARIRASMAQLTPRFSSARMLQEYVERAYIPAADRLHARAADDSRIGRQLAAWATRVRRYWHQVRIESVTCEGDAVSTVVHLGDIAPDAVEVQLYADPLDGEPSPTTIAMTRGVSPGPGTHVYDAGLPGGRPACHFTPRVVPYHPAALVPIEWPLIAWPG